VIEGAGEQGVDAPDFSAEIGCREDFLALASQPLAASIPGSRSVKTSVDLDVEGELSFQHSVRYPIHWNFLSQHRSVAQGMPPVRSLSEFNNIEYYRPQRRFLLGALTHYEGPDVWVYEISPYDNADAGMIQEAFEKIAAATFVGNRLRFHPTSEGVESVAEALPASVPVMTTDELYEGIDYQPLNVAESIGRLSFATAADLEGCGVSFRDIVVLDSVPNDISVTQGIITSAFQTPLSHINVLSQNRGTPNMGLQGAYDSPDLRQYEDQWVRLNVGPSQYAIEPVSEAEAEAWWEANRPSAVQVPGIELSVTDLRDVALTVDAQAENMLEAIKLGTRAFGGKASNYGVLKHIEGLPVPDGFAVPLYYYRQFMEENGFVQEVEAMLADPVFQGDGCQREAQLEGLRDRMRVALVNPDFDRQLMAKLGAEYPGIRMRFRSSTNAEDLDGFTGAGLYTSRSGEPNDPEYPVFDAVRRVWASVWRFRAFEERAYRNIDHLAVGMGLLVHRSFPDEEANGVALTNNPFDRALGVDPAFYVNVQKGEFSVVLPEPGHTTEEFLYYYDTQNQPVTYLSSSTFTPGGRVLETSQVQALGAALDKIRTHFRPAYQPELGANPWWAMDVEFKFDGEPGESPAPLWIKQARPFGNR
jgi:hypothetical protein